MAAAPAAQAMHSGTVAEPGGVGDAVVSLSIGAHGTADGDCTGTAIAPHWVLTARHCVDGENEQTGSLRIGPGESQRTAAIDHWAVAPRGDVALMHTREDLGLAAYPELATQVDQRQPATIYGWSPDGSGSTSRLPMGTADFETAPGFSLYDEPEALQALLRDDARIQPGDSGGPLFIGDRVAGVLSAAIDPDHLGSPESPVATVTPLPDAGPWIADTISREPQVAAAGEGQKPWQSPGVWAAASAVVITCLFGVTAMRRRRGIGAA